MGGDQSSTTVKQSITSPLPPRNLSESLALKTKPRIHIIIPTEGEDSEGGAEVEEIQIFSRLFVW